MNELTTKEERSNFIEIKQKNDLALLETFPPYINIETVNICNARCIMCGIDFDSRKSIRMPDELFIKILSELQDWRDYVRRINLFFDNEPLLDKNLADRILSLKKIGMRNVMIASNASRLFEDSAKKIMDSGLDEIYFSIDSLKKERYEKIRVRLKFEQVSKNIQDFIKVRNQFNYKTKIRVQMVMQPLNSDEQEEFLGYWKSQLSPGDLIVIYRAHNWGGVVNMPIFETDERINSIPCSSLWGNAMIHSDGSMALCSVDTQKGSEYTLGNVYLNSIEEIWKGEKMRRMRDMHLGGFRDKHPLCNGCTTWREFAKEACIEL